MKTITEPQRWAILQLWNQVCKDRGWKYSDRTLRLATIGKIIGRELTTLDDVERLAECTKVMNELKAMLGVSVEAGMEATDPGRNRKRNRGWKITNELLPCLAIYPLNEPMGMAGSEAYLLTVMLGKSRWRKTDRPESDPTLADFDERTVEQIFWTVSARLNDKRKESKHTGHDMCIAAGIQCKCAQCRDSDKLDVAVEFAGDGEDPNWTV